MTYILQMSYQLFIVFQSLVKRSQELTASAQDQTAILSLVTKVTNALDAVIVMTQGDIQIEEYRQVALTICLKLNLLKKLHFEPGTLAW